MPKQYSVARVLQLLVEPDTAFEIRAIGCHDGRRKPFAASGYFDDPEIAAEEIARIDSAYHPVGIYWTLNPVKPACLARSPNVIKPYPEHAAQDKEITHRNYLPLDFAPVRPSGTPASDDEVNNALEVMPPSLRA